MFITVRPLRRDDSTESAKAGLLRDFDQADYYVDTTVDAEQDPFGVNINYDRGYQANEFCDMNIESSRTLYTNINRVGQPMRGFFDDI